MEDKMFVWTRSGHVPHSHTCPTSSARPGSTPRGARLNLDADALGNFIPKSLVTKSPCEYSSLCVELRLRYLPLTVVLSRNIIGYRIEDISLHSLCFAICVFLKWYALCKAYYTEDEKLERDRKTILVSKLAHIDPFNTASLRQCVRIAAWTTVYMPLYYAHISDAA